MKKPVAQRLRSGARPALVDHFLRLSHEDRRLRFGAAMSDGALSDYVHRLDFDRDALFAVHADDLRIAGASHVALAATDAEMGVSVLEDFRAQGVGSALFLRACEWTRNQFIKTLFVHCLTENRAMMHIARKSGMRVVADSGEAAAYLALAPADAASIMSEMFQDRLALLDYTLKAQMLAGQRMRRAARGC